MTLMRTLPATFALMVVLATSAAAADSPPPWSMRFGVGTDRNACVSLERRSGANGSWRAEWNTFVTSSRGLGLDYSIPGWDLSGSTTSRSRTHAWSAGLARFFLLKPTAPGFREYLGPAIEAGVVSRRDEVWDRTSFGSTDILDYSDAHSHGPRLGAFVVLGFDAPLAGRFSVGAEGHVGGEWDHLHRSTDSIDNGTPSHDETELRAHVRAAERLTATLRVAL
jgi:hypothetical protein